MALKTQGTDLYFLDPVGNVVTAVGCVTSLTGISAARDQIETTCLNSAGRTYEAGMPTPGAASFTIQFDPDDESHVRLHELFRAGTSVDWAVGMADGTAPPTVSSGGLTGPGTRSWVFFDGYISDFPFDFALNAVVTNNLSIQVSGFPTIVPKA